MRTKKLFLLTKIFTVVFILSICFLSVEVPRAQAVLGVGDVVYDPLNTVQGTITAGSAPVTAGATLAGAGTQVAEFTWTAVGEHLLNYAAYAAGQNLLTQLTNSTVKWIQGGFHGSPAYAVDTNQMFTEIADNIAGNLVLKLRGIATCNFTVSYKDDLLNAVYLEPKKRDYIFDNKATCPFKQNWGFTAQQFYNDGNMFTWDAFGAALEDGGNPYGIQTITAEEKAAREAKAKADKSQKLSWSNGFADIVDYKNCTYPPEMFYAPGDSSPDGDTTIPGMELTPGSNKVLSQEQASQKNAEMLSDPAFVKNLEQFCPTTTPGKIVGDQLTESLGVDMKKLGVPGDIDKIISAFLDQVMQKTIRGVFGEGNRSYSTNNTNPAGSMTDSGGAGVAACPVVVTTGGANVTRTTAVIKGKVTCASNTVNADVTVGFRWSATSFVRGDETPTPAPPYPDITHGEVGSETFSASLSKLTPGTTYYYAANANTSQNNPSEETDTRGLVESFTTSP